ncbi:hypothetical protein SDC9_71999 [bioreactor metagenome]|uniref:LicD/FKTN/FKRP nucleotidyltransferase domain-containing protein n=1 Tax=bioreactor metagenome TaxID=1076179 RepID=A0A644YHB6_9ZZZZ|nr:LicD family protein [Paludibacter sp.]
MEKINTPNGIYTFTPKILYVGRKKIDKKIAKQNLSDFTKIANNNNLKFGLIYGTLLGAVREHDFIDHDEDIDLFILSEQRDLFLKMLFDLRKNNFEVVRYDRRGLVSIMKNNEYIDIYIFSPFQKGVRKCCGEFVLEKYLLNTTYLNFLSESILIPKEYKEYLEFQYGVGWTTPVCYTDFKVSKFALFIFYLKEKIKYRLPDFLFYKFVRRLEKDAEDVFFRNAEGYLINM